MPLASQIDSAIPLQNFEVIRNQIGGILLCEFLNQKVNFSLPDDSCPTTVDIERFITIDESEFPLMIVSFDKGSYGITDKDYSGNTIGSYCYDVDIFTGSASTLQDGGDNLATLALHRMLGIARAILEDNRYCDLALPGSGIKNVHVGEIYSNPPKRTDNSVDFIHGKLKLYVEAPEATAPPPPTVTAILGGTTVHLYSSDKYFFWGTPATP